MTGNLPREQTVDFPPLTPSPIIPPSPLAPPSPVTPPPPAPFNCESRITRLRIVDYDDEMSDGRASSRDSASQSPQLEATPKGKSVASTWTLTSQGTQSASDTGSKRSTRDSPEDIDQSSKRPRRSVRGKGKAREEADEGILLEGMVVFEDTPVDVTLVPKAAHAVRYSFLLPKVP